MTTVNLSDVAPLPVSTVAELAAVTKAPVHVIFDSLSSTGSLEGEVIAANSSIKPGSVKTALKLLTQNGLVVKRNKTTGNRGRPPVLFFRASDAPALPEPQPANVVAAPETASVESGTVNALVEITG